MAKVGENLNALGEKVLIYGASGTGKSLLAGHTSSDFKIKWIDLENGNSVLAQLSEEQKANIEVAQVPDTPTNPIGIPTLLEIFAEKKGYICDHHGKWNCMACKKSEEVVHFDTSSHKPNEVIVIDTFHQISNSTKAAIARRCNIDFLMGDKFEFDHWFMLSAMLGKLLGLIQNSKAHVIVISHEAEITQEDGKVKLSASGGSENFAREIPKAFGTVIRTEVLNGKHKALSMSKDSRNFIISSRLNIDMQTQKVTDIFKAANARKKSEPPKEIEVAKPVLDVAAVVQETPASAPLVSDKPLSMADKLRARKK